MNSFFERIGGSLMAIGGDGRKPRSNRLTYAVGDIHGCANLMERLVEKILIDALDEIDRDGESVPQLIFLGDLIDRGPASKQVLDFLTGMQVWPEIEPIIVAGNHEAMLLQFLADPLRHRRWITYGGYETVVSYGLGHVGDIGNDQTMQRVAQELAHAMGDHVDLIRSAVTLVHDGNLAFVHAGADPDLPLAAQPENTLIWGCEAFNRKRRSDGIWVIHGHTIVDRPTVGRGKIAIDTGAYITGTLTALRIHGTDLSFLSETGT